MYRTIKAVQTGFTLVELMLTLAIVAILASVALSSYRDAVEKTNYAIAVADITMIEGSLERYFVIHGSFPADLSSISFTNDPWGNPYEYLNMKLAKGNGKKRKDKNLVPVNNDYDLYSKGPDGKSASPFTSKNSYDDIVRANDGDYIGKAEDY